MEYKKTELVAPKPKCQVKSRGHSGKITYCSAHAGYDCQYHHDEKLAKVQGSGEIVVA